MHTYEVKFSSMEMSENMPVPNPIPENIKFENKDILKARNEAFAYLKSVLEKWSNEKMLIFKDPKTDIFKVFDSDLVKDKKGEFDLAKTHQFPMFFGQWQLKIALFFDDKEIFRIGNIISLEDYETLLRNSKNEFAINDLKEEKNFAFHQIPFQNFYLFNKLMKSKSENQRVISEQDMRAIMKII